MLVPLPVVRAGPHRGLSTLVPMSELERRFPELDPAAQTVVICHHGVRGAYATQALQQAGFSDVPNLGGGLDAYAEVELSVPRY